MFARIPKIEKNVLLFALLLSAGHLALIAYAAYELGITVPDCVDDSAELSEPFFRKIDDGRYEVHVVSKMWSFAPNVFWLPTGATLDIFLSSKDVVHGFYIQNTNVNLMAVPGAIAKASVTFKKPGRYNIVCHEYCGNGHQSMFGVIHVQGGIEAEVAGLDQGALISQSSENTSGQAMAATPEMERKKLATAKGCLACHSLDGAPGVGPTFKGAFGKREEMADGSSVVVDEAYLRESILQPGAKVVKGFGPVMPVMPVTEDDLEELVQFIKSVE